MTAPPDHAPTSGSGKGILTLAALSDGADL